MKGINKVSRFFRHTLFSILFGRQAMIQRALGIIIGLNHNIPIEKWCLLSGEHTKPQKMKRIHGKREFPTMDVESRRVKPINGMKFPGLRVWVDTFWSIEFWSMNHSWMRLAWVVHRNSFFWLICDQLRVPWLRDACKAAKKKEIGARRLRETNEKSPNFWPRKVELSKNLCLRAIVDARQCRRIFVVSCFADFFFHVFHGSTLKCLEFIFRCNWRWFSHEKWRHETNLIAIQRIFWSSS